RLRPSRAVEVRRVVEPHSRPVGGLDRASCGVLVHLPVPLRDHGAAAEADAADQRVPFRHDIVSSVRWGHVVIADVRTTALPVITTTSWASVTVSATAAVP